MDGGRLQVVPKKRMDGREYTGMTQASCKVREKELNHISKGEPMQREVKAEESMQSRIVVKEAAVSGRVGEARTHMRIYLLPWP